MDTDQFGELAVLTFESTADSVDHLSPANSGLDGCCVHRTASIALGSRQIDPSSANGLELVVDDASGLCIAHAPLDSRSRAQRVREVTEPERCRLTSAFAAHRL
jgi:hypothetical protein